MIWGMVAGIHGRFSGVKTGISLAQFVCSLASLSLPPSLLQRDCPSTWRAVCQKVRRQCAMSRQPVSRIITESVEFSVAGSAWRVHRRCVIRGDLWVICK